MSAREPAVDALSLAGAIRSGQTSAQAVMEASIGRARDQAALGAISTLDENMGLESARMYDARASDIAPFGGVPFLGKDLGNHAGGLKVTAGSSAIASRTRPESADSDLFARFRQAGLLPFGLTTVPEFGLCLTSEPPAGPIARNPWDPSLSPGGSSGGAAAAVAAGIVAIAHATDAAGSIRVPAACCGIVGLKPTRGATPNGPTFGNHLMGLTGELVLARSVRDVRAALDAVSGRAEGPFPDPVLAQPADAGKPLRVGLVTASPGLTAIGPDQAGAARSAASQLGRSGCDIVELDAASLADLSARSWTCAAAVLGASLAQWFDALGIGGDEISPLSAAVAEEGRTKSAASLFATTVEMARIAHELWCAFRTVDILLAPALSGPPPRIGAFPATETDPVRHWAAMGSLAPHVALANVAGAPAISLPHGVDGTGLPLSVQLIGPMGADRQLLALAGVLAETRPWSYPWTIAGAPS
ncbi:MAG: amidase [Devosia sp.]|nr:amidase [Devosia sp.]